MHVLTRNRESLEQKNHELDLPEAAEVEMTRSEVVEGRSLLVP